MYSRANESLHRLFVVNVWCVVCVNLHLKVPIHLHHLANQCRNYCIVSLTSLFFLTLHTLKPSLPSVQCLFNDAGVISSFLSYYGEMSCQWNSNYMHVSHLCHPHSQLTLSLYCWGCLSTTDQGRMGEGGGGGEVGEGLDCCLLCLPVLCMPKWWGWGQEASSECLARLWIQIFSPLSRLSQGCPEYSW